MSNSLVDLYRQRAPNDTRSDSELTQLFGAQNDLDGRYNNFRDFVRDWTSLKPRYAAIIVSRALTTRTSGSLGVSQPAPIVLETLTELRPPESWTGSVGHFPAVIVTRHLKPIKIAVQRHESCRTTKANHQHEDIATPPD